VEALDTEIGRLFSSVPSEVRDRTTVIFLGDNGTASAVVEDEIDPDRAAGGVYEPSVRVPLIVSGPLVAVPGSVSSALVHVVDVLPTIADIVGTDLAAFPAVRDPLAQLAIDGESLLPLLADPNRAASRDVSYTERFSPVGPAPYDLDVRAVRDAQYKYVYDALTDEEQFFEYPRGDATDEGPDLLPCGLTEQQQAAFENLRERMIELTRPMTLDAVWEAGAAVPDLGAPADALIDLSCE
jgi:arylsulfatase A-like enzyme